jgi:endonuclease/exonuclease/phosphatase family metal-dependent hydrolase
MEESGHQRFIFGEGLAVKYAEITDSQLKILSYNVHKGRTYLSRNKFWHLLQELLMQVRPDIIFLQEFFREPESEKLLKELAEQLWKHHSYGHNVTVGDYHYGNAILANVAMGPSFNLNISTNTWEKRGLLYTSIETPDKTTVHLVCTHLNLTTAGRLFQLKLVRDFIDKNIPTGAPVILAGDFNDWNETLHPLIEKQFNMRDALTTFNGRKIATFPSVLPVFVLDRIYYRRFRVLSGDRLLNRQLRFQSDHLPITTTLELLSE